MVIRIGDGDITLELHSTSSGMFDMHICEISTGLGDVGYFICNPLFGIIYEPSHNGKTNSQTERERERERETHTHTHTHRARASDFTIPTQKEKKKSQNKKSLRV
jgi:hypothetical protein